MGGPPPGGQIVKKILQIKKASERIVFLEERILTADTCIFPYNTNGNTVYWDGDPANIMHGNGANFGFADGHADFHQWKCASTRKLAVLANLDGLPTSSDYVACHNQALAECNNEDAKWMGNAVWGVMPQ
jgi:prepilin-type processing-associated H-X9-DG protein